MDIVCKCLPRSRLARGSRDNEASLQTKFHKLNDVSLKKFTIVKQNCDDFDWSRKSRDHEQFDYSFHGKVPVI